MSACPDPALLDRLLTEQVPAGEREALEEHLSGCTACQAQLDRLTADADSARWWHHHKKVSQEPDGSDPLLWRRVATLGAVLLDRSLTIHPDTPAQDVSQSAERPSTATPPTVPGYELLGEVGRGGMAVVYRARQISLGRIVALKMILAGPQAVDKQRDLLRAEAQAIAGLQHPNIVQIYEVAEHDGRLYLSLEYLAGGSLARFLAGVPQPPRIAAAVAAALARAVDFAHDRGIVHRDLKPSNVLLAGPVLMSGEPSNTGDVPLTNHQSPLTTVKIADFGLAKRLNEGETLFDTADIVGTPSYVAPEQVRNQGDAVGPAADVYALGAILYECLTGRPPFRGETAYDTLLQVVHTDPVGPRRLQPTVPRDLETICLKCLHKDPRRRYPTARALAEDLDRFLAGAPIRARSIGMVERTVKWIRRRPGMATMAALVLLLTLAAFALLAWQWDLAEARVRAEAAAKEEAGKREEEERRARQQVERLTAGAVFDRALALCERGEVATGLLSFAHGLELAERSGDTDLARAFRMNLAGWETRLVPLQHRLRHKSLVWDVAYSPMGDLVATAGNDGIVGLWDPATGQRHGKPLVHDGKVYSVAFSPDGKQILGAGAGAGNGGAIVLWDVVTGKRLRAWSTSSLVNRVHYCSRGERFVTRAYRMVQLWSVSADQPIADLYRPDELIYCIAVSPDSETIATGSVNGVVRRWPASAASPAGTPLVGHDAWRGIETLAFSPDGKHLAAAGPVAMANEQKRRSFLHSSKVWLWEMAEGRAEATVLRQDGNIVALAFSSDSRLLATGSVASDWLADKERYALGLGQARIYELTTGRCLGPLPHPMSVMSLAFTPDSRLLLTGCEDGNARLFSVVGGQRIGGPLGHEGAVMSVAISPDGRTALTASAGGDDIRGAAARVWAFPSAATPEATLATGLRAGEDRKPLIAFGPEDAPLLTAGRADRRIRSWSPSTGNETERALDSVVESRHLVLSRDGRVLAATSQEHTDRQVRLWERATCRELPSLSHEAHPRQTALSPDGRLAATEAADRTLTIWDTDTGKQRVRLHHQGTVMAIAFPTKDHACWVEEDNTVNRGWQWNVAEGRQLLWEKPLRAWLGCFDPDGLALIVSGDDRFPRLIDAATGQPLGPPLPQQSQVGLALSLAADRRTGLIGSPDGTARVWDMVLARPLGPPLHHYDRVWDVALSPHCKFIATTDKHAAHVWTIPAPIAGSPTAVREQIERATGMALDAQGIARER
jgi:WD40 repeat protein